jgi:ketosteroid isomerase-like protein
LEWHQENPGDLIIKYPDAPKQVLRRGQPNLSEAAMRATRLPTGAPEGYIEGFANIYREATRAICAEVNGEGTPQDLDFPTVEDGVKGMAFITAAVQSTKNGGVWDETTWNYLARTEVMKMHVLLSLAALAIGFAVPALAQEQNTVDPEVRQQIEAALLKFEEAFNNHDAAAMATLFTVDAVQVLNWGEGGTFSGQQANEKNYAVDFASRAPEFVEKLIQVYAIGDEISAISEWSHGPWKGYHARIYAITVNGSAHC